MKYKILLFIFIIAFLSSLFLSQGFACKDACNLDSSTNSFIPDKETNGYIGMAIFLILSILTYLQMRKPTAIRKHIIHIGVFIGSIISIYFLYLQIFVLKAFCKYCLVIDIGLLITLILVIIYWRK